MTCRSEILLGVIMATAIAAAPAGCSKREDAPDAPAPASRPAESSVTEPPATQPAVYEHIDADHMARAQQLIDNGVRFLLAAREEDGGWSLGGGAVKPATTAMVLKALLQHRDFNTDSTVVRQGFDVLMSYRQPNGGFYEPRGGYENYTTSLAVMAMAAAQDSRFNEAMRDAVSYLKGIQIVPGTKTPEGQDIDEDHPFVGGVSYGKHGRPDGSNAGMFAEALHEAGVGADDPAMQNVLGFFLRLQNRSESNPLAWAAEGPNDGGFVYAPALRDDLSSGESKAGPGPGGRGLRSYGSLTYLGFKTLLHAGLDRDDPRVRAAYGWIRTYWRLDSNPNMPQTQSLQGLYYYYHAFAKALRAWSEPVITDTGGVKHNWRQELIDALGEQVRPDGSWVNPESRWEEASPVLVTCYAVLALQETLKSPREPARSLRHLRSKQLAFSIQRRVPPVAPERLHGQAQACSVLALTGPLERDSCRYERLRDGDFAGSRETSATTSPRRTTSCPKRIRTNC